MTRKKSKRPKRRKRARSGPVPTRPGSSPKKERLRRRWLLILGLLGAVIAAYAYDRGGPIETIPAQVVEVQSYPHTPRGGQTHTHTDVVIEYEGAQHTLERVDGLAKGEWVNVEVRRGRLSGWAHYEGFRGSAAFDILQPEAESPEPWEYDVVLDKHWDPVHGHWHDGPPPSQRQ